MSVNLNGVRSAAKKSFFTWLPEQNADVICVQETKAQQHQLTDPVFYPAGYHSYYVDAVKKGYSGTAIYSKIKPKQIITSLGFDLCDTEGRYLQADFENLSVISVYLPSGSSSPERQACKFEFLDHFYRHLKTLRNSGQRYIICGDWNIAHKKIDLKNWRGNQKNSGFLPEERAWLDEVFDTLGFIDAFREVNQEAEQYTWWSNRGQAWAKNVGWRIDYQIVTPELRPLIKTASIYKDQRFSDHAPLLLDYDLESA